MKIIRELLQDARAVLGENDRGDYSVPSGKLYPVQFNWDSAFASLGYRTINPDRAWRELETLAAAQRADGMIPHIVFRGECGGYFPGAEVWRTGGSPPSSGITQPPVAAMAAHRLHQLHGVPSPPDRLDLLIRRLAGWHEWFFQCRRDPQTGAALVVHPWESGRDNAPDWDSGMARVDPRGAGEYRRRDLHHVAAEQRPLRTDYDRFISLVQFGVGIKWNQKRLGAESPFRVTDPLTTAVLAKAERDLAVLAKARGIGDVARAARLRADKWTEGMRNLWCEKIRAFTARDATDGESSGVVGIASFLSPLAGVADDKTLGATMDHFDRIAKQSRFVMPSADPEHAGFNPRRYWRGPVWAFANRLVGWGLEDIGENARAARLRDSSEMLAVKSGFWEYYDPRNGEGLGGPRFTWTAAVFLDWRES